MEKCYNIGSCIYNMQTDQLWDLKKADWKNSVNISRNLICTAVAVIRSIM